MRPWPRSSVCVVSGGAATGKTTAIKQLGRFHELRTRRRFTGSDRIPVVYVTAPPKGSPRKLAMEFARFLGLPPVSSRANATDIADTVCQILIDARCDIVVVDEIHNINMATTAGEDHSDHMKYFTEHLPATFIYAGIDVERSGLFEAVEGNVLIYVYKELELDDVERSYSAQRSVLVDVNLRILDAIVALLPTPLAAPAARARSSPA